METVEPVVTRDIYPMPAFVTLAAADVDRVVDWYVAGLDFVPLFTLPGPDGAPALVHLRRWRYQDLLVRPAYVRPAEVRPAEVRPADVRPAGPGPGGFCWTPTVLALAEQLGPLADRARAQGGGTVEGPVDTPWNTRDLISTDPEGNRLVLSARRPEGERDERFGERIQRLAREQGL